MCLIVLATGRKSINLTHPIKLFFFARTGAVCFPACHRCLSAPTLSDPPGADHSIENCCQTQKKKEKRKWARPMLKYQKQTTVRCIMGKLNLNERKSCKCRLIDEWAKFLLICVLSFPPLTTRGQWIEIIHKFEFVLSTTLKPQLKPV